MSVIATGGYGRKELYPFSDIDLHFLIETKIDKKQISLCEQMIHHLLYLLWDTGFKVGHATRNMKEALEACEEDGMILTSLLDGRIVVGDKKLLQDFQKKLQTSVINKGKKTYLQWRLHNQAARHHKTESTPFLQEPNTKIGCGGLRDAQNLLWVMRIASGTNDLKTLQRKKLLFEEERKKLEAAILFISNVRYLIQTIEKRASDVLSLKLQPEIAYALGYKQKDLAKRIEVFMHDYYRHAKNLFRISRRAMLRLLDEELFDLNLSNFSSKDLDPFVVKCGVIDFKKSKPKITPFNLLNIFFVLQQHGLMFSPFTEFYLEEKVVPAFKKIDFSPELSQLFLHILQHKGNVAQVLRKMHEIGFLGKLIPEFSVLTCLVQHEFFHHYTADEHTLACLEALDKLSTTQEKEFLPYKDLLDSCPSPEVLYLSILMHDTGRSQHAEGHAKASGRNIASIAKKFKASEHQERDIQFLVENHLLMSEIAQRRNLEDVETISNFCKLVETPERLRLLMLLTYADGHGVGGQRYWSNWKEQLVWSLFHKSLHYMESEPGFLDFQHKQRLDAEKRFTPLLENSVSAEEIRKHIDSLPLSYLHSTHEEGLKQHIEQVHHFITSQPSKEKASIHWSVRDKESLSVCTIVTHDRKGLFARITGAFAASDINILSAHIYTRQDGLAVDTFYVNTPLGNAIKSDRDFKKFEAIFL
jgi:[protein-PII] uridylyltransferase